MPPSERIRPINWPELLRRYANAPASVREDIGHLIAYAKELHAQNLRLRDELLGATQTVMALCRAAGGTLEIPIALVRQLDDRDQLVVTDVDRPFRGPAKQFHYVAHRDPQVH
jgi:hypothetical protein